MAKRFERALDSATQQTLVEPDWEGILECVDMIRGLDVPVKDALSLIQKKYHSSNPHIAHHALLVLEACVKNCGKRFHMEIATKEFLDDLQSILMGSAPEKVSSKILELIQCWASAFRNNPEYKIVIEMHNFLKLNGFEFPVFKEADAMFMADSAPDWAEGDNCYRCRTEFGVFTRKHHCRACGQIFCDKCSNKQMLLPQFGIEKKVRVCESCFDKRVTQKQPTEKKNVNQNVQDLKDEAEQKRQQELADKEAEDLQLALAISQSEAEAKEQERNRERLRQFNYGNTDVYKGVGGTGQASTNSLPDDCNKASQRDDSVLARYLDRDYWERKRTTGTNQNTKAPVVEENSISKMENDASLIDPVLAKYLDRDYWEQKKRNENQPDLGLNATAPPPSDASSSNHNGNNQQNSYAASQRGGTPSTIAAVTKDLNSFDQLSFLDKQNSGSGGVNDENEVEETSMFCKSLREMVDTMDNRMRSNLMRGRSIVNDSAIHSLFAQLTNYHANVLSRMTKLETDREYYENLQDHLAHIQVARQAINSLREDFERQRVERLRAEQNQRRIQIQQKLELMRQKKNDMLLDQRNEKFRQFQQQQQQFQKPVHNQQLLNMNQQQFTPQYQQMAYANPQQLAQQHSNGEFAWPQPHQSNDFAYAWPQPHLPNDQQNLQQNFAGHLQQNLQNEPPKNEQNEPPKQEEILLISFD